MENTKAVPLRIDLEIEKNTVLFFDMDGTLVDTNLANFLAYEKAISFLLTPEISLIYNPDQRFNRSVLKETFPKLTDTDFQRIVQAKEECYEEFLCKARLIPETACILFEYSKKNQSFLVTNCRKERAFATLNYFGLVDKFADILCREIGDNEKKINKFQNALSLLGVSPKVVIAFENEETEIQDAKEAGIKVINPLIV